MFLRKKENLTPESEFKVLIIRLGAIGDVVHTTNTYRAIKKTYPNAKIHYLTTSTQSCLLEADTDIEKVWVIEKKDLKIGKSQKLAQILRDEHFDIAINFQPNIKTRLLVWLAGIKNELIYKKTFKEHAVKNFFQTAKKYFPTIEIDDRLTLYLPDNVKEWAKNEVSKIRRPIIAINAGGMKSPRQGRTYPLDKWLEVGTKFAEKGASIVITGAAEDIAELSVLKAIPNSYFYAGRTTIEQNAALIGECDLMISGDSGPLHIAAALDVPSVGLYGSMPISRTGTYGDNCTSIKSDLKCVPCNRRKCKYIKGTGKTYTPCMENIDIDTVIKTAEKLLKCPKN